MNNIGRLYAKSLVIGKYKLIKKIGEGGYGEIFQGIFIRDWHNNRPRICYQICNLTQEIMDNSYSNLRHESKAYAILKGLSPLS